MKVDTCHNCKDEIDEFNENEYFGINSLVFCSLGCFYDNDKKELNKIETRGQDSKIKNGSQTNQGNKRKNSLQSKRKKSKKRQR
jgi:hypothetical protein